jgi:hypothetical protein
MTGKQDSENVGIAGLGDDLVGGMESIAEFWGMPPRKAYHLATKGHLPGVFQMGRQWFLSKAKARAEVQRKASGAR